MSRLSGIDAHAVTRQAQAAISRALTDTMGAFRQAANTAYAGTRFAGTFTVAPTPLLRTASLVNAAPLLQVVEYPTQAHPIAARTAPALHFYWPRAGRWFHGPAVRHPGTRGKRLIDPLHTEAAARLGLLLHRYLDELNRV